MAGAVRRVPVVEFPTNQPSADSAALNRFRTAVLEGDLSHDGSQVLAARIGRAVAKLNPQGELVAITTDHPDSPRKIDAPFAAVIGFERACWHRDNAPEPFALVWGPEPGGEPAESFASSATSEVAALLATAAGEDAAAQLPLPICSTASPDMPYALLLSPLPESLLARGPLSAVHLYSPNPASSNRDPRAT